MSVLVLGGGMSGLCAALAATEAGVEVTVLEAGPHPGGSMRLSGGLVWAPRDLATARRYIPKGDPMLQELLVTSLPDAWEWLERHDLPLGDEVDCLKDDMGRGRMLGLGSSAARGPFAEALADRLAPSGRVVTGTTVTELTRDVGGWVVTGDVDGAAQTWRADAIVAATGGFQNSLPLLGRFVTPTPNRLFVRSNRVSAGTGLTLLQKHGAALSNGMSSFYGHSLPYLAGGEIQPGDFIPASQYYSDYTLAINLWGLRFTDESLGVLDEHNAQLGARQPESRYFLVFDEGIRQRHVSTHAGLPGVLGSQVSDRLTFVEELGGTVHRADSLEGLAELLETEGVPPENFLDTVRQYNQTSDPVRALFPPRLRDHEPLVAPPYYAVSCVAAITYTMGGLRVGSDLAVLDRTGRPVPGAFAAGADAGGVFQDVYGGGLAWALVSGRRAGLSAATA